MKNILLFVVAFGALGLLAGCGSSSSTSGSSISKAAFIKKADALCESGNKEQSAALRAFEENEATPQTTEAEIITKIMLPHIKRTMERFAELEPPSGEEAKIEALVAADMKAIEVGLKNPGVFANGETTPFKEGTSLSKTYGFKVCGQY
jgi:hypothetical protein